jgi:hypothetical protein
MIANNEALAMFRDEDQLADILEKEFTLEKLYDIMHFAHGASDIRKTNDPDLEEFFLNMFVWAGVYIRRAELFPSTEGKDLKIKNSVFGRIKLFLRAEDFKHITVEMMPNAEQKPLFARGTGRKKKESAKSIQETHPGFKVRKRPSS